MRGKTFGFKTQMGIGDAGERDFRTSYPELKPEKSEDRAVDFILSNGQTVELKTDTYPMEKTPNFFMETLSDTNSGKLGGPWRAQQDGVAYFVYYFVTDKTFFWFDPKQLCLRLEKLIAEKKYRIKSIANRSWTTQGYAVPREDVADLCLRRDSF